MQTKGIKICGIIFILLLFGCATPTNNKNKTALHDIEISNPKLTTIDFEFSNSISAFKLAYRGQVLGDIADKSKDTQFQKYIQGVIYFPSFIKQIKNN